MSPTTRKFLLVISLGILAGTGLCLLSLKIYAHFHGAAISKRVNRDFQNGDIIFQTSRSSQSEAIQLATHSKYSHCGIIFWEHAQCYVLEAAGTVTWTPIDEFIKRGRDAEYVVKRLKNADEVINGPDVLPRMTKLFQERYEGKPYDIYFERSDDKIYCSELVWKMYKEGLGVEVGELQTLKSFDLTSPVVKKKMEERYKGNIPYDEIVISPAAIFESEELETVARAPR